MKMPFGKYKGIPIEQLPVDYLYWLLSNVTMTATLERAVICAYEDQHEIKEYNGDYFLDREMDEACNFDPWD